MIFAPFYFYFCCLPDLYVSPFATLQLTPKPAWIIAYPAGFRGAFTDLFNYNYNIHSSECGGITWGKFYPPFVNF